MATCTTSDLLQEAACFSCLSPIQLELIQTAMLCRILQNVDPMANCDVNTLLESANCFTCLFPFQLQVVQTQLLCEILNSGGGLGSSCLLCGDSDPVETPLCECALYYNKSTSSFWYWDSNLSIWAMLIGGI
jgi:hypothetical protein